MEVQNFKRVYEALTHRASTNDGQPPNRQNFKTRHKIAVIVIIIFGMISLPFSLAYGNFNFTFKPDNTHGIKDLASVNIHFKNQTTSLSTTSNFTSSEVATRSNASRYGNV